MKARGFLLMLTAFILAGCDTHSYNSGDAILITGYTGYHKVSRAVKKHVYAAPGARLDDFERRIKQIEGVSRLDSDFDVGGERPSTNGAWRYCYEGKKTVYYGRFIKEESPPPNQSGAFDPSEILDPVSLAAKLKTGPDPISADLFSRFSAEGRSVIAGYPQSGLDEKALQGVLAKELSEVIAGSSIYDEHRFAGVTLRPMVTTRLNLHPGSANEAEVLKLGINRFLLEDAYPRELTKVQRVDYTHWYVAIKY
jgi:hypothetical protein